MAKKVKLGLRKLDTKQKIGTARKIIAGMKNNTRFPDPDPELPEIEQTVNLLESRYTNVLKERTEIHRKTMEMNAVENELDKKITLLASYVESKSKGDVEAIKSAGMDVRADSVPVGIPDRVKIKSVNVTLNPGELKLNWEKVRGAKIYSVEYRSTADPSRKMYDSTTKTKILFNQLKSGTKYKFRVQAIGSAGKGQFSDPVEKYAP